MSAAPPDTVDADAVEGIDAPAVSAWIASKVPGATPPFSFELIAVDHPVGEVGSSAGDEFEGERRCGARHFRCDPGGHGGGVDSLHGVRVDCVRWRCTHNTTLPAGRTSLDPTGSRYRRGNDRCDRCHFRPGGPPSVSYTHLRAHETGRNL